MQKFIVLLGDDPQHPSYTDPTAFGPYDQNQADQVRRAIVNDFPGCEVRVVVLKYLPLLTE